MKLAKSLQLLKSPILGRLVVCFSLFLVIVWLAYNRYPTYLDAPNFYGEDGPIFAKNVTEHGFWSTLFTPFNGYLIVGLYLLEGLGFLINNLFFAGNLLNLPQSLAIVSYAVWGILCTLPVALFWNDVKRRSLLLLLALALALVPLPGFNYALFGTIGNYKFAFMFVAFLLIIKRWRTPAGSKLIYWLDAGLALCVLTNATTYLLLPFTLLPYWPGRKNLKKDLITKLLHNKSFVSLMVVFGVGLLQLVYIALRGGVDELAGYLQEPFEFAKTIEIFLQRTLLFPFDHGFAKQLSDPIVIFMTLFLAAVLWKIARREDRRIVVFGFWTALMATTLFVSQRTGVSQFFSNYQSSGTDHFFYAQNMVMIFTAMFVIARRVDILEGRRLRAVGFLILALVPIMAFANNDVGKNELMNRGTGSLWYATQQACETTPLDPLVVPIYPVGAPTFTLDRKTYCTKQVESFVPAREPVPVAPFADQYYTVGSGDTLTQTFTAHYNNLRGVSPFFATFGGGSTSTYRLNVMDEACQKTFRSTTFSALPIDDNAYFDVRFDPITNSKGKRYCFSVVPEKLVPNTPPLAIRLSEPDIYPEELAKKNGADLQEDAVFDVLYKPFTP
jgi:hypothetical protein